MEIKNINEMSDEEIEKELLLLTEHLKNGNNLGNKKSKFKNTNEMSDEEIDKELSFLLGQMSGKESVSPPTESSIDQIKRSLKNYARGAASVADILVSPIREGMNLAGLNVPTLASQIPKGGNENPRRYYQDEIEEAIGSMLSTGGMGTAIGAANGLSKIASNPSSISKVADSFGRFLQSGSSPTIKNVSSAAAGAAGAQAAADSDWGDVASPLIGMAASMAPGMVGGPTGGGSLKNDLLKKMLKIDPEKIKTMNDAGITPSLGNVSDSKIVKSIDQALQYVPGKEINGKPFKEGQYEQIIKSLNIDESPNNDVFGDLISKTAQRSIKNKKDKKTELYKEADSLIDNGDVDLSDYISVLKNERLSSKNPELFFDKSERGKLLENLLKSSEKNKSNLFSYKDINDLRIDYGQQADRAGAFGSDVRADPAQLKRLYGDLNKVQVDYLEKTNPEAFSARQKAQKYTSENASKIDRLSNYADLSDAKGEEIDKAFKMIKSDLNVGARDAALLAENMNASQRKSLVDKIYHSLGSSGREDFNLSSFLKNYKKLDKPVLKTLKTIDPNQKRVDQMDKVISSIDYVKFLENEANHSKSAIHTLIYKWLNSENNVAKAAFAVTGMLARPFMLNKLLFQNEDLLNAIAYGTKVKTPAQLNIFKRNLAKLDEEILDIIPPSVKKDVNQLLLWRGGDLGKRGARMLDKQLREEEDKEYERGARE